MHIGAVRPFQPPQPAEPALVIRRNPMEATNLQIRLAHLAPGETLLLPVAEIEEAFHSYATSEERLIAAVGLAELYQCSLTVCRPGASQILFTRHEQLSPTNFA